MKILLIDADDKNFSIHEFFGTNKYSKKFQKIKDKNSEFVKTLSLNDLIIPYKKTNLNILPLNYKINIKQIVQEIGMFRDRYDLIFIDMPSYINSKYQEDLMKISNKKIFLSEPNLIGISKLNKILEDLNIDKEELKESSYICFNKYTKYSIDKNILNNFFDGYKNLSTLKFDNYLDNFINKGNIYVRQLDKIQKIEYQNIISKLFEIKQRKFLFNKTVKQFNLQEKYGGC